MGKGQTPIPDDVKRKVIALWNEGLAGSEIAERCGLPSRSAVQGLIYRNRKFITRSGRNANPKPHPKKGFGAKGFQVTKSIKHKRDEAAFLEKRRRVEVMQAGEPEPIGPVRDYPDGDRACHFMHGDVADVGWRMCGHPRRKGSPYCDYHAEKLSRKHEVKATVPRSYAIHDKYRTLPNSQPLRQ